MFHPSGPTFAELTRQCLASTVGGYDLLAPKFDYTPFRTPDTVVEATIASLPPAARGVDICCGTGVGARRLRGSCDEVVGIDFSPGMLAEARRREGLAPHPVDIRWVHGDVIDTPVLANHGPFDVAVCFGALGHIHKRDQPTFARAIYRALRPGGRFAFPTSPMPGPWTPTWWLARTFNGVMHLRNSLPRPEFYMVYLHFTLRRAIAVLEEAGFVVVVQAGVYEAPFERLRLVTAHRPSDR